MIRTISKETSQRNVNIVFLKPTKLVKSALILGVPLYFVITKAVHRINNNISKSERFLKVEKM